MKKFFTIGKMTFAFIFIFFALSANAADCSKVVDVMCQAFSNMNKDVNTCKSLDELSNLDFENCMNGINPEDVPDSCLQYRMTRSDKTKLKNSIKGFTDNLVNKMYELSGGIISKDFLKNEVDKEMSKFYKAVDDAETFQDFVDAVN